jgi:hypothetical protein
VEHEPRVQLPSKGASSADNSDSFDETFRKLSTQLSTICIPFPRASLMLARAQKYFRTRENRNFSTVRSTESRIIWFSIIESILIIALSGFQVFVVRTFFQKNRKGYV